MAKIGELLPFLLSEKDSGRLSDFNTECQCGLGQRRVDYRLVLHYGDIKTVVWIELKHFQVGWQGKERWKASNYFGDKSIGIQPDVEKLSSITDGDKYIFILATKNPEYEEHGDWEKGVDKFNEKFAPLHIRSHTITSDFPQSYFLGLLEVI
ncbi:MAG: hypothetical protein MUO17_04895 [Dehalococcoidales bacterium]|nr:hypothetical protein [Dehalococcoidales bacterium]